MKEQIKKYHHHRRHRRANVCDCVFNLYGICLVNKPFEIFIQEIVLRDSTLEVLWISLRFMQCIHTLANTTNYDLIIISHFDHSRSLSFPFLLLRRKYCFRFRSFVICLPLFIPFLLPLLPCFACSLIAPISSPFCVSMKYNLIKYFCCFDYRFKCYWYILAVYIDISFETEKEKQHEIGCVCVYECADCAKMQILYSFIVALSRFILFYFYSLHSLLIKCCKFAWNSKTITNETAENCLWKRTN